MITQHTLDWPVLPTRQKLVVGLLLGAGPFLLFLLACFALVCHSVRVK